MSFRDREIESKWILSARTHSGIPGELSLATANRTLTQYFGEHIHKKVTGASSDTYWHVSNPDVRADFIRVRDMGQEGCQLTVKGVDRGTNEDRMEMDINIPYPSTKVIRFVRALLGTAAGKVEKHYDVYWPTSDEHMNISLYQVRDDSRIFMEIETTSNDGLRYWEETLQEKLPLMGLTMERAPGSIYQLFIRKETEK